MLDLYAPQVCVQHLDDQHLDVLACRRCSINVQTLRILTLFEIFRDGKICAFEKLHTHQSCKRWCFAGQVNLGSVSWSLQDQKWSQLCRLPGGTPDTAADLHTQDLMLLLLVPALLVKGELWESPTPQPLILQKS